MGALYDLLKEDNDLNTYHSSVNLITKRNNILHEAFFQLTPLCNLRCKMCYARLEPQEVAKQSKGIMMFEDWKWYIDEAVKLGLTELNLTGGECTIHPDFCKIYSYAYDQGLQISVLTNLVNISDRIFDLWKSKPPLSISITVYGASADTYDRLCKNKEAYFSVFNNIQRLEDAGYYLNFKYTAVRENINDMLEVERRLRKRGHFLYPVCTLTKYDRCDHTTLEEEAADEELFQALFKQIQKERNNNSDDADIEKVEDFCDLREDKKAVSTKGIACSAARNTCQISWDGMMTPCIAFDAFKKDPRNIGFRECWEEMNSWGQNVPVLRECLECIHKYRCNRCIALHYNDTGELGKVSPRLCWKQRHPEKAKEVEEELISRGLLQK